MIGNFLWSVELRPVISQSTPVHLLVAVGSLRSLSPIPIHWATCSSCFVQDYHEFGVPPTKVGMNECSQHPQRQPFRVIHKCLPVSHPKMVLKAPLSIAKTLSFFSQYPKLQLSNLNVKMFTTWYFFSTIALLVGLERHDE